MNKSKSICLLGVLMLVVIIETSPHSAFAATYQVTITQGSGAGQSCVTTATCYDPANLQIAVGDTVTWTNQDSVGHTVTSGQPTDTQRGTIFDSSLIIAGGSYSFTFQNAGDYKYSCMVHPWITGEVIVDGSSSTPISQPQPTQQPPTQESISVSTDKSSYSYPDVIAVSINVNPVIPNQTITLNIESPSGVGGLVSVSPNPDGSASYSIPTDANDQQGTYTIRASYGSATSQTTFSYVGSQSQTTVTQPQAPSISNTTMSSTQYEIPDWVKNVAKWWGEGQISEGEFVKAIQYLIDNNILTPNQAINEISQLQQENQDLNQRLQYYEEYLKQYKANVTNVFQQYQANVTNMVQQLQCLPTTTIYNQTLSWHFCDSKGKKYDWSMPIRTYDYQTKRPYPTLSPISENTSNGTSYALDYTPFVEKDFSNVIDQVYDNSGSDSQFLYNVWYIVSQFTPYSTDITTSNVWPLETFTRAGGDCKDTTILTADMIRSSSHTADWKLGFIYVNAENPTSNLPSDHVFLEVTTPDGNVHTIETTDKITGFDYWNGKQYNYWYVDVP